MFWRLQKHCVNLWDKCAFEKWFYNCFCSTIFFSIKGYLYLVDCLGDQDELNRCKIHATVIFIQHELYKRNFCSQKDQPGTVMTVISHQRKTAFTHNHELRLNCVHCKLRLNCAHCKLRLNCAHCRLRLNCAHCKFPTLKHESETNLIHLTWNCNFRVIHF